MNFTVAKSNLRCTHKIQQAATVVIKLFPNIQIKIALFLEELLHFLKNLGYLNFSTTAPKFT